MVESSLRFVAGRPSGVACSLGRVASMERFDSVDVEGAQSDEGARPFALGATKLESQPHGDGREGEGGCRACVGDELGQRSSSPGSWSAV